MPLLFRLHPVLESQCSADAFSILALQRMPLCTVAKSMPFKASCLAFWWHSAHVYCRLHLEIASNCYQTSSALWWTHADFWGDWGHHGLRAQMVCVFFHVSHLAGPPKSQYCIDIAMNRIEAFAIRAPCQSTCFRALLPLGDTQLIGHVYCLLRFDLTSN